MDATIIFIGLIIVYFAMTLIWIFRREQLTTLMFSIISLFYMMYAAKIYYLESKATLLPIYPPVDAIDSSLLLLTFFIIMTIFGFTEYILTAFRYLGGEKE